MLLAVSIWGPGEALLFMAIMFWVVVIYGNKYLSSNPEVKDMAKKAAAKKAMNIIAKWLK